MEKLLEVRGLKTHFDTDRGLFRAVDQTRFRWLYVARLLPGA